MSQAIPHQHPAVVMRSQYQHVRALLVVALIAVIGLVVALVIVASNSGGTSTASVTRHVSAPAPTSYYGGREEGQAVSAPVPPSVRYDGGREEGTAGR
jgi:hypothetical protein